MFLGKRGKERRECTCFVRVLEREGKRDMFCVSVRKREEPRPSEGLKLLRDFFFFLFLCLNPLTIFVRHRSTKDLFCININICSFLL